MTTAELLRHEGRVEGRVEGLREACRAGLAVKGAHLAADLLEAIEGIGDIETLTALVRDLAAARDSETARAAVLRRAGRS